MGCYGCYGCSHPGTAPGTTSRWQMRCWLSHGGLCHALKNPRSSLSTCEHKKKLRLGKDCQAQPPTMLPAFEVQVAIACPCPNGHVALRQKLVENPCKLASTARENNRRQHQPTCEESHRGACDTPRRPLAGYISFSAPRSPTRGLSNCTWCPCTPH